MKRKYSNESIVFVILSFLLIAAIPAFVDSGIPNATPIEPYFGNKFPSAQPATASSAPIFSNYQENINFRGVLGVTQAPNSSIIYVSERNGFIYSFDKDVANAQKQLFRDMEDLVWNGQDSGLLGLAFHPEFNMPGSSNANYLYIYYVTLRSNKKYIRVSRLTRHIGAEIYDQNSEQILIEQDLSFTSTNLHRGGALVFGDDGFLYITIGDLGVITNSQNITERLAGGVLRIDVDKKGGAISHPLRRTLQQLGQGVTDNYYIPSDNPWVNSDGSVFEEYFAVGCRSPHKMSKDQVTGTMYIGNVGSNSGVKKEEINVVQKGANYGWPFREGETDRPDLLPRPANIIGTVTDPLFYYEHNNGSVSVNGGYVYRGSEIPELYGKYIFGDYGSRRVWSMNLDGTGFSLIATMSSSYATFGQDTDGEIYIGQLGNNRPLLKLSNSPLSITGISGDYFIRSKQSGKYFDVSGVSTANGANIHQWSFIGATNQQWAIESEGSLGYILRSKNSDKVAEAAAFGTANGTNVQQWAYTGTNSQIWTFEKSDDDYFKIRNVHNNLYLNVANTSSSNGVNIELREDIDNDTQLWELVHINGPAVTPPRFLSDTGVFSDLNNLVAVPGVIPYDLNVPFWSDGAEKKRWVILPNDGAFNSADEQVDLDREDLWSFDRTRGQWSFPPGTVFVKHFEIQLNENTPSQLRKLETRFTILQEDGKLEGLTYRWNSAGTDAELIFEGATEDFTITQTNGSTRSQKWTYPGRSDCITCHTEASGGVLGAQTSQLNGNFMYPSTGLTAGAILFRCKLCQLPSTRGWNEKRNGFTH